MKNLVLSEKAYDDLLQIMRYIAQDRPQVAVGFVDKLQAQCEFLALSGFRHEARRHRTKPTRLQLSRLRDIFSKSA